MRGKCAQWFTKDYNADKEVRDKLSLQIERDKKALEEREKRLSEMNGALGLEPGEGG